MERAAAMTGGVQASSSRCRFTQQQERWRCSHFNKTSGNDVAPVGFAVEQTVAAFFMVRVLCFGNFGFGVWYLLCYAFV